MGHSEGDGGDIGDIDDVDDGPTMTTTTTATRKSGSLRCSSVVLDFLCCPGSYSFRLQCAPRGGDSGR